VPSQMRKGLSHQCDRWSQDLVAFMRQICRWQFLCKKTIALIPVCARDIYLPPTSCLLRRQRRLHAWSARWRCCRRVRMLSCGSRTAEEEERAFSRVGGRTDMETGEGPGSYFKNFLLFRFMLNGQWPADPIYMKLGRGCKGLEAWGKMIKYEQNTD
jgi:hypothetical protein